MDLRQVVLSVVLCVGFVVLCNFSFAFARDKIRIHDLEVLTLYQGKMTTGRRSTPVPQVRCVGGSAGCSAFVPQVIQCYNRGWDGYDAQWECKTDMDNKYRFGKINVNCEGYDYRDDPYILRGSCGVEYTIELTEEGYGKQRSSDYHGWNSYQDANRRRWQNSSGVGDLVMLAIVGVIFYMLYSTCISNRHRDTETARPPYQQQDPNNMGRPGPSAPPPPYSPDPPGFKREYTQGNTAQPPPFSEPGSRSEYTQGSPGSATPGSSTNSNSGFWTGAATGGLLGYLFGGRTRSQDYYHNPYNRGWGGGGGWGSPYNTHYGNNGGWFGNWFGGGRSYSHRPSYSSYGFSSFGGSSSSPSSSSSGSRTTSGMGGSSRR